jgi:hypothetical protein
MSTRRDWAAKFLLLALLAVAAPQFARAATQCACFYNANGTPSCDLHSGEGIETEADCTERCQLFATGGKAVTSHQFFDDQSDPDAVTSANQCTAQAAANPPPTASNQPAQPSPIVFTKPRLAIDIPGVSFSDVLKKGDKLSIPFLADYLSGVYRFLLGASLTIAIVMVMVGGVQYAMAGATGDVEAAKTRIRNAVTGLLLLFGTYVILYTVNPQLTLLKGIEVDYVQRVENETASGAEGTTGGAAARSCQEAVAKAHEEGACPMTDGAGSFGSPTGSPFSCNYHFSKKGIDYDYTKIRALDFPTGWGLPLVAPFDGTIEYVARADSSNDNCGNIIRLKGSGTAISICHVKDFVDGAGLARTGARLQVLKGEVIGHTGGRCCEGETPPAGWSQGNFCTYSATKKCGDPFTSDPTCTCQPKGQSGNTSGPHAHVTWLGTGNFLSCVPN